MPAPGSTHLTCLLAVSSFILTLIKADVQIVCDADDLDIRCPQGEVLVFKRANYGRTQVAPCESEAFAVPREMGECEAPETLGTLARLCFHRNHCTVEASEIRNLFGDPCPSVNKYLEVEYQCTPASSIRSICSDEDTVSEPKGFLTSENYPDPYLNGAACRVKLMGKEGQVLKINMIDIELQVSDSSPGICYDFVVLVQTGAEPRVYCSPDPEAQGKGLSYSLDPENYVKVSFESSIDDSFRGFLLQYEVLGCAKNEVPLPPPNGNIELYQASKFVVYGCDEGYEMSITSSGYIQCQGNTWVGDPGVCIRADILRTTTKSSSTLNPEMTTTRTSTTNKAETPSPATPSPATPAPTTPVPSTPVPATPAPATPVPATPAPTTPVPATPAPTTPVPATPVPATPAPGTPVPTTPSPATPATATPSPATPAPATQPPTTNPPTTTTQSPISTTHHEAPTTTPYPTNRTTTTRRTISTTATKEKGTSSQMPIQPSAPVRSSTREGGPSSPPYSQDLVPTKDTTLPSAPPTKPTAETKTQSTSGLSRGTAVSAGEGVTTSFPGFPGNVSVTSSTTNSSYKVIGIALGAGLLCIALLVGLCAALCIHFRRNRKRQRSQMGGLSSLRPALHAAATVPNTYMGFSNPKHNDLTQSGELMRSTSTLGETSSLYDPHPDNTPLTGHMDSPYDPVIRRPIMSRSLIGQPIIGHTKVGQNIVPVYYIDQGGNIDSGVYEVPLSQQLETILEGQENEAFEHSSVIGPASETSSALPMDNEISYPSSLGKSSDESSDFHSLDKPLVAGNLQDPRPSSLTEGENPEAKQTPRKVNYPLFKQDSTGNLDNYLESHRASF